ncbi:MAG: kynureninase [Candidatus Heimdallarchaeota archaeon]
MAYEFDTTHEFAKNLDMNDPLRMFRNRFYVPKEYPIYLLGNSLGLLSRDAEISLLRVIDEWKTMGIGGWWKDEDPWFYYGENLGALGAPLVGAEPTEVVATGTTTMNVHSVVSTFYHPSGKRTKILADPLTFPTDLYALQSQIRLAGLPPDQHLVLAPSDGRYLDESQIVELMTNEIALIFLPSALYRSGQLLDVRFLTREAHKREIPIGFDCSHSVGVVPHFFDEWMVDFAVWCGYKYLNAGPGATAFIYINKRHFNKVPGLAGWFGYEKDRQFELNIDFQHALGAGGWQMSGNILPSAALKGTLEVTLEAGILAIRNKSSKITSYLIYLVDQFLSRGESRVNVGTPRDIEKRTGHVSLEHPKAKELQQILQTRGIMTDYRPPNVLRIAPHPLYTSYTDIWKCVSMIKEILEES